MNKVSFVCATAILFASPLQTMAGDYLGAAVLLKKAATSVETDNAAKNADSGKKLSGDLKAFRETSATLTPEEAASRWLSFADRLAKMPHEEMGYLGEDGQRRLDFASLMESLPSPAAWDALTKAAEARPEGQNAEALRTHALRLTLNWMTGNTAAQKKETAALQSLAGQLKQQPRQSMMQILDQMQGMLLQNSDDGQAILANLIKQLNQDVEQGGLERRTIFVPDLVTVVGVKETTAFLKNAFKTERVELNIEEGVETKKLACKLALQMIDELKAPQWCLAQSLDAAALYEALSKRFPKAEANESGKQSAQTYYLLSLIASQRTQEAIVVAAQLGDGNNVSLPEEGLDALDRAGHGREVAIFLHDLLEKKPNLPFWDDYVSIAPRAGQTDPMVALAEAASQREGMTPKQQQAILKVLAQAYLAADDVEKGVGIMRKQIAAIKAIPSNPADNSPDNSVTNSAAKLARLGIELERKDLVDEGIEILRDSIKNASGVQEQRQTVSTLQELADLLAESKRGPEAEAALAEVLCKLQQPPRGQMPNFYEMRRTFFKLMALYHQANRPADVIALLDHAPSWGAKDLKDVYLETTKVGDNGEYIGYLAASALAAEGRTAEALPIVETLLDREGGYDPAYELLIQIAPDTAMAKFDALFARDPFEERPLIWKAKLLLKAGNLEEAEKCARKAIAIDPTDGEEGPGRRLRAYATLGEIREARGDKKEAAFLQEVLTSVRHSDKADRLHEAGLITRSLKIYEEALTHFSDAYCIQARIAFRKAELGDMAGAEEHYRRAYELMPDSFGRVESYCFGCEGAFHGAQAQGIAERVFTKLAEKSPQKPQIHYLLGYLRFEQDRFAEALPEFRQAVKLDPDYLNAWKKLAETTGKVRLPAAERDAIQFNLLRLDPLGRHSDFEFNRISDLRAAWMALDNAAKSKKPAPESLYPLAASVNEIKKQQEEVGKGHGQRQVFYPSNSFSRDESPGKKIASQGFVNLVGNLFIYAPQLYRE